MGAETGRRLMPLEILNGALVLDRCLLAREGAEIAPLAGTRILLARIETPLAAGEFANHRSSAARRLRQRSNFLTSNGNRCSADRTGDDNSGAVGAALHPLRRGNNRR